MIHHAIDITTVFNGLFSRKVKPLWIQMWQEMMEFWDAVASAGPYANNLHLAPDR